VLKLTASDGALSSSAFVSITVRRRSRALAPDRKGRDPDLGSQSGIAARRHVRG